jgi:hypothetical protein
MGYTIKIGQAEPIADHDEYQNHEYGFGVAELELPDAPRIEGDVNQCKNYRWPSYSVWTEFTRDVGLYSLFFDDSDGLIRPHPGVIVLRPEHGATIRGALEAYRLKHPGAVARFDVFPPGTSAVEEFRAPAQHPNCDYSLARLEWLSWWVDWALANCSRPAMENS